MTRFAGRARLNQRLIVEFTRDGRPSENHTLIAQLPIHSVWTTNYDTLLEEAFRDQEEAGRRQDRRRRTWPNTREVPTSPFTRCTATSRCRTMLCLTKEDYETYAQHRELFTIRLKGDLVSQTFLFLGFSFTDPNIDYILSRVRILLEENTPTHYCIIRRPEAPSSTSARSPG